MFENIQTCTKQKLHYLPDTNINQVNVLPRYSANVLYLVRCLCLYAMVLTYLITIHSSLSFVSAFDKHTWSLLAREVFLGENILPWCSFCLNVFYHFNPSSAWFAS